MTATDPAAPKSPKTRKPRRRPAGSNGPESFCRVPQDHLQALARCEALPTRTRVVLAVQLLLYQLKDTKGIRTISVTDIQEVADMWSARGAVGEAFARIVDDGIIIAGPVGRNGRRCQLGLAIPENPGQPVSQKSQDASAPKVSRKTQDSAIPENPGQPYIRSSQEERREEQRQEARTAVTVDAGSPRTVTNDDDDDGQQATAISSPPSQRSTERHSDELPTSPNVVFEKSRPSQPVSDVRPTPPPSSQRNRPTRCRKCSSGSITPFMRDSMRCLSCGEVTVFEVAVA